MARMKPEPAPEVAQVSLVASAAVEGYDKFRNLSRSTNQPWYKLAWEYYHSIGEYRYVCDWIGNGLSKAVLHATKLAADGSLNIETTGPAKAFVERLMGDPDGQAEMQRLLGIHWTVTGDAYLVAHEDVDPFGDGGDVWHVVAPDKLKKPTSESDRYAINGKEIPLDQREVMCLRLWRPDPEDGQKAISPTQAVLSTLGEIARLTDHMAAQIDSRLAGAGILLVPSEITFPAPPTADGAQTRQANTAVDLMRLINQAMAQSIRDRADASAMVPIVITAPGEAIQHVQHLTFWSELDEKVLDMRNQAIKRLALGMDVPPEVLQGMSDSNHWSAWQADESAIKAHIEPLLKILTSSLAKGYLRPLLKSGMRGIADPVPQEELRLYSIGADTSELRLRPNRSKEAFELYDRGELNGAALRRETGFDPTVDGMDEEARKLWLLMKIAQGSPTPEFVEAALKELGIDLQVQRPESAEPANEPRPTPSLEDHPNIDIPDPERSARRKQARERGDVPSSDVERASFDDERSRLAAAVAVGSEQAVFRALERAGNRMRNKMGGKLAGITAGDTYLTFGVQPGDLDFYLEDAWGDNISALAEHAGISKSALKDALDGYCRILLTTQKPHTFKSLEGHLKMALRGIEAAS